MYTWMYVTLHVRSTLSANCFHFNNGIKVTGGNIYSPTPVQWKYLAPACRTWQHPSRHRSVQGKHRDDMSHNFLNQRWTKAQQ